MKSVARPYQDSSQSGFSLYFWIGILVVGVLAFSAFGAFYATRIFEDPEQIVKSHLARVKVDMCLLESRLRDYRDRHQNYPAITQTIANVPSKSDHAEEWNIMMHIDDGTSSPTTIAFGDPLRNVPGTFAYQYGSNGDSYIITSYGPDGDSDIDESLYTGARMQNEPDQPPTVAWRGAEHPLAWYMYDPSNGLMSDGDVVFVSP